MLHADDRRDLWMRPALWSVLSLTLACGSAATVPAARTSPAVTSTPDEALPADIVQKSALPLGLQLPETSLYEPELWDELAKYRAVCLGEQHDDPEHHYAQLRAIEELASRHGAAQRPLAVGYEMFQTPYQPVLSAFVAGTLPEADFLVQSEYRQRWGFDFALYRPLLEVTRDRRLAALALNAPRELTRKISRSGLDALEPSDRAQLPELDLQSPDHRAYFERAMGGHPMPAGGPRMDDMYAVQVVWDETMADTAARWLAQAGPSSRLIVLAGAGHCHKSAIPARLARRLNEPVLSVTAVRASGHHRFEDKDRYDQLIVLQDVTNAEPSE